MDRYGWTFVVCRWRDVPRLLMHGKRIRIGRVWGEVRPYFMWGAST